MSVIHIDPAEMSRLTTACTTTEQRLLDEVSRLKNVMSVLEEQSRQLKSVNEEIAAATSSMYSTGVQVRANWQGATAQRFDALLPEWQKASTRQAELVQQTSGAVDETQRFLDQTSATVNQLSTLIAQTSQVVASMVAQIQAIDSGAR
jgi:uncharacterized protein YukE